MPRARRGAPPSAAWLTCRWAGVALSWWCACGAWPALTVIACGEDTSRLAGPRARLTHSAVQWALEALGVGLMSVSRVAQAPGVARHTDSTAVLARAQQAIAQDPHRFAGVEAPGVDEHVWRRTKRGDRYVTVIIDLTPVRDGRGPARLLDMVPGRSRKALKDWLSRRDQAWCQGIEVVAVDGLTGFRTAAAQEPPSARTVIDPFHVVALAAGRLDECRRRTQRRTTGGRGRKDDPLYQARRTLRTGADLLTDAQAARLEDLFAHDHHAPLKATWGIYQRLIQAYRAADRGLGRFLTDRATPSLTQPVPAGL